MSSDPVSAGRKGGRSRSAAKLAAAKRNGFQRVYVKPAEAGPIEAADVAATKHNDTAKQFRDALKRLLDEPL
jgi:hypothetical protein